MSRGTSYRPVYLAADNLVPVWAPVHLQSSSQGQTKSGLLTGG